MSELVPLLAQHGFGGPGWLHPLTGADHIVAMVAVGAWSAQIGRRAVWLVPAAFVTFMGVGAGLGLMGVPVPYTEPVILASVVLLGIAIALDTTSSRYLAMAAVAAFGVAHGYAHGAEAPSGARTAYVLGILATTAALHLTGVFAAMLVLDSSRGRMLLRVGGVATLGVGVALVAQTI